MNNQHEDIQDAHSDESQHQLSGGGGFFLFKLGNFPRGLIATAAADSFFQTGGQIARLFNGRPSQAVGFFIGAQPVLRAFMPMLFIVIDPIFGETMNVRQSAGLRA